MKFLMIYPFCLKKKENYKREIILANLHDKEENFIHIRNLKQTLSHVLVLKKVQRVVIKFNQKAWLQSCIDMETELRKKIQEGKYQTCNK